jgi:hypothetical protein
MILSAACMTLHSLHMVEQVSIPSAGFASTGFCLDCSSVSVVERFWWPWTAAASGMEKRPMSHWMTGHLRCISESDSQVPCCG